jgi:aspartate carbamoyltransferase regulatory subunit
MHTKTQLQVEAIQNGTVIDHIPAHLGLKIAQWLDVAKTEQRVTLGLNLPSSEGGNKDLIKIENVRLTQEQLSQLAIVAPNATVNDIHNYQVVNKHILPLPSRLIGHFPCPNSNCITHVEPVKTQFHVMRGENIKLRCCYCEKTFSKELVTTA